MGISGHEFARVAFDATVSGLTVPDPGTGGTINLRNQSWVTCELTLAAAAETRLLPTASGLKPGVHLFIVVRATGSGYYARLIDLATNDYAIGSVGECVHYMTYYNGTSMVWANLTTGAAMGASVNAMLSLATSTVLSNQYHVGKILLLTGTGAAYTQTLPAAAGTGKMYRFVVGAVNTSNHVIDAGSEGADFFGNIISNATGDSPDLTSIWPAATNDNTITLNGTTMGGAGVGDYLDCIDIAANKWMVRGVTTSSGAEATPFSTV